VRVSASFESRAAVNFVTSCDKTEGALVDILRADVDASRSDAIGVSTCRASSAQRNMTCGMSVVALVGEIEQED
jgi:hypothetical protein